MSTMSSLQHIFVFFFILTIGIQLKHAQDNPEVNKLEQFYYNKCLTNSGSTAAFDKLRTDTYEMYKYFEYAFQFLPNQKETFCKTERSNLMYRIKEIASDLKPCLSANEKYLSEGFIKTFFEEFLHFFCHNNGEYTRRFFSNEGTRCRNKIGESNANDLENCMNRIFGPTKGYITKPEMCDDITVARKCFTQLLVVHCPSSYDFKELNEKFFDFIWKPCSSCVHLISSFVLFGSLLVHFLINKF